MSQKILDRVVVYKNVEESDYSRFIYEETTHARIIKKVGECKQYQELYDEAVEFYKENLNLLLTIEKSCNRTYLIHTDIAPYGTSVVRTVLLYLYEEMAKTYMLIGDYYEMNGDFKVANNQYEEACDLVAGIEERVGDLHSQKMHGLAILKQTDLKAKYGESFLPALKYSSLERLYMSNMRDNPFLNFADREELENLEIPENLNNLALMKLRLVSLNKNAGIIFEDGKQLQESIALLKQLEEALQTPKAKRNLALSYELQGDLDFSYGNIAEAFTSYTTCLTLRKDLDLYEYASILEKVADVYSVCKQWKEAFAYYEKSLEFRDKHPYAQQEKQKLAILYEKMGDVHVATNNHVEGNVWYNKGIELTEEIRKHHDKIGAIHVESFSEFRMGKLYQKSGDFNLAEQHYLLCIENTQKNFDTAIKESEDGSYSVGFGANLASTSKERLICYSNICYQLKYMNQKQMALDLAGKSEEFDYDGVPLNQIFLGDFYNENEEYDKAVNFYGRVLDDLEIDEKQMSELSTDKIWNVATCYERIGTMFLEIGEAETAREYYKACIKYREALSKILPKTHVLRELANGYKLLGDEEKAYETLARVKEIYKKANLPFVDTVEMFDKRSNVFRLSIETIFDIYR